MDNKQHDKHPHKHNMSGNDPLDLKGKGWDGEYVGNIWGWRFSMLSLAIIVFVGGLMMVRSWQVGHIRPDHNQEAAELTADSLSIPSSPQQD